jgi:hypothetical protein
LTRGGASYAASASVRRNALRLLRPTACYRRRRGLPIGNLTSEFFANLYLDIEARIGAWIAHDRWRRCPHLGRSPRLADSYYSPIIVLNNDRTGARRSLAIRSAGERTARQLSFCRNELIWEISIISATNPRPAGPGS